MYQGAFLISVTLLGFLRLGGHFTEPALNGAAIHHITGQPSRFSATPLSPHELKVVTWNIERGVEFDRILTTLQGLDADILLLQEVDSFCRRSGWRDVARDLADGLAMNWVAAGEFQEIGESKGGVPALTGQAILSRYPLVESSVLTFENQARLRWRLNPVQPRRGGRMALRARSGGVLAYNAHIESGGNDRLRRKQLDEILADLDHTARTGEPVVIAGDFNNVPAIRSAMFAPLTAADFADAVLGDSLQRRTSVRHAHAIDWIFVRNAQSQAARVELVADASDHYPVLATLVR